MVQPAHLYCRRVLRGVAAFGAEAGWEWLPLPPECAPAWTGRGAAELHGVIGDVADAGIVQALLRSGLPAVNISPAVTGSPFVHVAGDDVAVGRVAAAHLLSLGLAHYGFFGWRGRADSAARERGFAQTIDAAGLRCDTFLWPSPGDAGEDCEQPDRELAGWVAALPKPAGVLAADDGRALQLLAVCRQLRIPVPEAAAVVGVDNDEVFCDLATPSLSSVALSAQRIGYEAAGALELLMRGTPPAGRALLIPPAGVVPRRSSGLKVVLDADVAAAVRYIALHARDGLQVSDVLGEVHVSRRSLDQRFLKVLGRTASQEIGRVQVELAKRALAETVESMGRVAAMAGFSSAKQLGAHFRLATGTTPTSYRRRHRA